MQKESTNRKLSWSIRARSSPANSGKKSTWQCSSRNLLACAIRQQTSSINISLHNPVTTPALLRTTTTCPSRHTYHHHLSRPDPPNPSRQPPTQSRAPLQRHGPCMRSEALHCMEVDLADGAGVQLAVSGWRWRCRGRLVDVTEIDADAGFLECDHLGR